MQAAFLAPAELIPVLVSLLDHDRDVAIAEPVIVKPAAHAAGTGSVAHARIVARDADMIADPGDQRELRFVYFDGLKPRALTFAEARGLSSPAAQSDCNRGPK